MRAAILHGPGDLRVEDVPEPEGEVVVEVQAASSCGTDAKMLAHGHRVLGPYPARFGHETAGVRLDTGERVFVGDSVACLDCPPCRAGRRQLCRRMTWVLGGFAERVAAPAAALHHVPDALPLAGAAMAEPLAACVHAVSRAAGAPPGPAAVLGGGTIGLMLARLLTLEGREVTVADRHEARRDQAHALGAAATDALEPGAYALVLEAVGRADTWSTAVAAAAPGGTVVLVGGCPAREVALPSVPLHYDEVDVVGAFHHDRDEVDRAIDLLASGAVDWRALAGPTIGLEDLAAVLTAPNHGGEARKPLVDPRR